MKITVLFFASLREQFNQSCIELSESSDTLSISQVWRLSTNNQPFPKTIKVSINQQYVAMDSLVNDGDEVAFFPPVTGG